MRRSKSVITYHRGQTGSLRKRIFSPLNIFIAAASAAVISTGAGLYAAYVALDFIAKSVINPSVNALTGSNRDDHAQNIFLLVFTIFLVRHALSTPINLATKKQNVQTKPNLEAALPGLRGIFASPPSSPKAPHPSPNDSIVKSPDPDSLLDEALKELGH